MAIRELFADHAGIMLSRRAAARNRLDPLASQTAFLLRSWGASVAILTVVVVLLIWVLVVG